MRRILSFLCTILSTSICYAANPMDSCSDILKDGTMAKTNYKSNDFLQQIIHSRYFRQAYDKAKNDTSFGANIPIDDIMVGVEWNQKTYEEHQEAIRRSLDFNRVEQHELEIAISSGDPVIAEKWADCMKNDQGGLFIWFVPQNAKTAVMHVYWNGGKFKPGPLQITSIKSEPARTWSRRTSNCLWVGRKYDSGRGCQEPITLLSSTADLVVTADGKGSASGDSSAYLGPRLGWVSRVIPLESRIEHEEKNQYARSSGQAGQTSVPGSTACLSKEQIGNAIPLASTFKIDPHYPYCYGAGHCEARTAITHEKACWQAFAFPVGASCGCNIYASVSGLLSGWYPVDSKEFLGNFSDAPARTAEDRYRLMQTPENQINNLVKIMSNPVKRPNQKQ
jgi:hypothetical protein